MEWGLLPEDEARKVLEKKQGQKLKSPVKTLSMQRRASSPTKKVPLLCDTKTNSATKSAGKMTSQKKRKASSDTDDDEDDFMPPKMKTKKQKTSS